MRASLALALLLAAPAAAQAPPRVVEVDLSSFAFTPATLHLRGGEPVVLRLVNAGRGGHNFSAPEFFAAASPSGATVRSGAVEVPSQQTIEVRVTPQRGTYALRCTHTLHSTFGMRGQIVVD